jgi:hypothetical protein
MKSKLHLGRGAAILACAASLAGTAAVVAPAAASAATTCANKTIKVPVEGSKAIHIPVKGISTEGGVSCATAYKVIGGAIAGKPPSGWKSVYAHYELPKALAEEGLLPQLVKNGSKKVKYAVHGG